MTISFGNNKERATERREKDCRPLPLDPSKRKEEGKKKEEL